MKDCSFIFVNLFIFTTNVVRSFEQLYCDYNVRTVPYNKKSTSRALESYFSNWEKESLAQIFFNTKKPAKGHCETLYQINY